MNADDRQWIQGLRKGNERTFSDFFSLYRNKIYHLALKIMNDPAEAEEVVQ
jgi:DNA-directed RNA polymerase specialized sigma24 family protein